MTSSRPEADLDAPAGIGDPVYGVESLGPDPIWGTAMGDLRGLLTVGRLLTLQVMHPVVDAGVAEHSVFKTDPYGRLERSTAWSIGYFMGGEHAAETAAALRRMHRTIGGVTKDGRPTTPGMPRRFTGSTRPPWRAS